jgi:hypothetical protein
MGTHHIINGFNGGLSRDERLSNLCGPLHGARGPLSPLNTRLIRSRVIDEARTPNLPAVAINCISPTPPMQTHQPEKLSTWFGK